MAQRFGSASVVAVDGSATMLEHVTAHAERLGLAPGGDPLVDLPASLETLGQTDVAWASMVLHHVGDEVTALRRIRGLLEPGELLADVLIDQHADESIMCRDDALLSASRHLYVARSPRVILGRRAGQAGVRSAASGWLSDPETHPETFRAGPRG
ncbi:MAG: class I SAM-dependent methyltransferase [Acidimicrobiia bacterium]